MNILDKSLSRLTQDMDTLMLLEEVEQHLRNLGCEDVVSELSKLQVDAGLYFMSSEHRDAAGPETARLLQQYEKVTEKRLNSILTQSFEKIEDEALKERFSKLVNAVKVNISPQIKPFKQKNGPVG